jgi:hypothetical protein
MWLYKCFEGNIGNLWAHIDFSTRKNEGRNKAKTIPSTSDLYNYTKDPTIPYKITNYAPKIYEERRKYNSETGLVNKGINSNDTNLLLKREASGFLDNIISNKYNGIKNIIKLSPIKMKSTNEGADHIGIIFDIVIDEEKFKYDYEKDPKDYSTHDPPFYLI